MNFRLRRSRSLTVLLLAAACSGCTALPFSLPGFGPKPKTFDEQQALAEQKPADAVIRELSPEESCKVCMTTAKELEANGKEPAAIEQYERARAFLPKQTGIAARLAVLYDRAGNHEQATTEYAAALKEDPKNADLWNDYAYYRFQRDEFADAETAAQTALKFNPEHKRCWVNLGLIQAEQEKYDEAFTSFGKAVSPAAAHNNLGMILARQGKIDRARKELAEARKLDPMLKQPVAVLEYLAVGAPLSTATKADPNRATQARTSSQSTTANTAARN
jgi:tetratricopeptide (TPR) repeat protein